MHGAMDKNEVIMGFYNPDALAIILRDWIRSNRKRCKYWSSFLGKKSSRILFLPDKLMYLDPAIRSMGPHYRIDEA